MIYKRLQKKILLYGKYASEAFNLAYLIPERIRLIRENRSKLERFSQLLQKAERASSFVSGCLWHEDAVLPGDSSLMPWAKPDCWAGVPRMQVEDVMNHRICVLSESVFDVNDYQSSKKDQISALAEGVSAKSLAAYVPIKWHTDFKSGYAWASDTPYTKIKVAPEAGVDIKTPRELSRFQHIGILACNPSPRSSEEFVLEVLDWIVSNPFGHGVNWGCTMDVALRAVNWIWGMRYFQPFLENHLLIASVIKRSLYQHALFIEKNLEYYKGSTGNHYLADILGLLYIGCVLSESAEADRWVLFCMQELVSEMKREVYDDGAAHEGSTHYHRLVAELFASGAAICERLSAKRKERLWSCDVTEHSVVPPLSSTIKKRLNLTQENRRVLPNEFYQRLYKMGQFTAGLTKPNHRVPQFGDNDSARAHKLYPFAYEHVSDHRHLVAIINKLTCDSLERSYPAAVNYEAELICGGLVGPDKPIEDAEMPDSRFFRNSGIAVVQGATFYLAVTCGTNGQHGRGGHGHNDKLSFELNIKGKDYVVDGGCPVYTADPVTRNLFRGTWAHSTVYVKDREQDSWSDNLHGLFVLRERSFPKLKMQDNLILGQHYGFEVLHRRSFNWQEHKLLIQDNINLLDEKYLTFNFHPAVRCTVVEQGNKSVTVVLQHSTEMPVRMLIQMADDPVISDGFYSEGYGVPVPTQHLAVKMTDNASTTIIEWD